MELRNIYTFLKVVEQHSFSKAAKQIGYTQGAVTMQIQALEKELGVALFDRMNKSIQLTPYGEKFLVYAQSVRKLTDETLESIKESDFLKGSLRIAMADSICTTLFPDILTKFHSQYPDISLKVETCGTIELMYRLNHNEADFVYTFDKRFYHKAHVIEFEKEEPVYFVAAPDSPLRGCRLTLEKISHQPLLLTESEGSYQRDLNELLAMHSIEIRPILQLSNIEILKDLVKKGLGVSFLPAYAVNNDISQGKLIVLDVPECNITEWRQLLRHRDKNVTPQMKALIDTLNNMGSINMPS